MLCPSCASCPSGCRVASPHTNTSGEGSGISNDISEGDGRRLKRRGQWYGDDGCGDVCGSRDVDVSDGGGGDNGGGNGCSEGYDNGIGNGGGRGDGNGCCDGVLRAMALANAVAAAVTTMAFATVEERAAAEC